MTCPVCVNVNPTKNLCRGCPVYEAQKMQINMNGDTVETLIAQATQLQAAIGKLSAALGHAMPNGRNQPSSIDIKLYHDACAGLKAIAAFNDHFTNEIGRQM